jgi:hypothetical protein
VVEEVQNTRGRSVVVLAVDDDERIERFELRRGLRDIGRGLLVRLVVVYTWYADERGGDDSIVSVYTRYDCRQPPSRRSLLNAQLPPRPIALTERLLEERELDLLSIGKSLKIRRHTDVVYRGSRYDERWKVGQY